MEKRFELRFQKKEKETLKSLAKNCGMSVSEYIRYRLLDQNPDLLDGGTKYLCPQTSKQAYFLAFSVMKLQRMLKEVLIERQDLNLDAFSELDAKIANKTREIIAKHGYKKLTKDQDE